MIEKGIRKYLFFNLKIDAEKKGQSTTKEVFLKTSIGALKSKISFLKKINNHYFDNLYSYMNSNYMIVNYFSDIYSLQRGEKFIAFKL